MQLQRSAEQMPVFSAKQSVVLGAQWIQSMSKSLCSHVLRLPGVFVHLDITLEHQNEVQEVHGVLFLIKRNDTADDQ